MHLVTGTIRKIVTADGERTGTVSVNGAMMRVALTLLPEAVVGDVVLVESGVAIARVDQQKEGEYVPGDSR